MSDKKEPTQEELLDELVSEISPAVISLLRCEIGDVEFDKMMDGLLSKFNLTKKEVNGLGFTRKEQEQWDKGYEAGKISHIFDEESAIQSRDELLERAKQNMDNKVFYDEQWLEDYTKIKKP